jgi:hypothetical protein
MTAPAAAPPPIHLTLSLVDILPPKDWALDTLTAPNIMTKLKIAILNLFIIFLSSVSIASRAGLYRAKRVPMAKSLKIGLFQGFAGSKSRTSKPNGVVRRR